MGTSRRNRENGGFSAGSITPIPKILVQKIEGRLLCPLPVVVTSPALSLCWMQYPEGIAAVGPDQNQRILIFADLTERLRGIRCRLHGLAAHFDTHVTTLHSGIVCRTAAHYVLVNAAADVAPLS